MFHVRQTFRGNPPSLSVIYKWESTTWKIPMEQYAYRSTLTTLGPAGCPESHSLPPSLNATHYERWFPSSPFGQSEQASSQLNHQARSGVMMMRIKLQTAWWSWFDKEENISIYRYGGSNHKDRWWVLVSVERNTRFGSRSNLNGMDKTTSLIILVTLLFSIEPSSSLSTSQMGFLSKWDPFFVEIWCEFDGEQCHQFSLHHQSGSFFGRRRKRKKKREEKEVGAEEAEVGVDRWMLDWNPVKGIALTSF